MDYQRKNQSAYDQMVRAGSAFAKVATDAECAAPLATLDSRGWIPRDVRGMKVLCLAAGGGWQSVLYACAGAEVTVVDLSEEMLRLDAREAQRRRLTMAILQGSMEDLSMLEAGSFDIVHQPVSSCYIPSILVMYVQIARVLKVGGIYISQHKQPVSLQLTHRTHQEQYVLGVEYYHGGPLPVVPDRAYREAGTSEFLHRWEDLVGGLCRAGFVLEDLVEPKRAGSDGTPGGTQHRGRYVAPYVRLKARRVETKGAAADERLWLP